MTHSMYAATGHRPPKLGGYDATTWKVLVAFAETVLTAQENIHCIYCGMALGWDLAVAQAAINLGISFVAAIPFRGHSSKWPPRAIEQYYRIAEKAYETFIVSDGAYAPWKMQKRNQFMVDRVTKVLALWDGSPGGTANCVAYAQKKKVEIENLWDAYVAFKAAT